MTVPRLKFSAAVHVTCNYVPQEKGSGQCPDRLVSGYAEITGVDLYSSLSSARSEPGACLF